MGFYLFDSLPPGTYKVVVAESNWDAGKPFGPGGFVRSCLW